MKEALSQSSTTTATSVTVDPPSPLPETSADAASRHHADRPVIVHIRKHDPSFVQSPKNRQPLRWLWLVVVLVAVGGVAIAKQNLSVLSNYAVSTPHEMRTKKKVMVDEWDFGNGPPVRLPEGQTIISRERELDDDTFVLAAPATRRGGNPPTSFFPGDSVVDFDAPADPAVAVKPTHAAEALMCTESVKNYVINATDAKDECDGLTKAFEKACSDTDQGTPPNRRRRLRDKIRVKYRWRAVAYEMSLYFKHCIKWVLSSGENAWFFAEDAVAGEAWDNAKYAVENDMDKDVFLGARAHMEQMKRRRLVNEATAGGNSTKAVSKPMSLDLPKSLAGIRVSEAMLDIMNAGTDLAKNETEELQAEDPTQLETKQTARTISKEEQVAPYDPTSQDARTCCVSILSVYQESCSIEPETDVSDLRLFSVVFVMGVCGMVKSLIRHFRILWLPEAAGCILVGGTLSFFADSLSLHGSLMFVQLFQC
jgi:hypothetical protein